MASTGLRDPELGGGAEGLEPTVQGLAGWINGYGANDPEWQFPAKPRYDGSDFILTMSRINTGPGLFVASGGANHLRTDDAGGGSSDLPWAFGSTMDIGDALTVGTTGDIGGNLTVGGDAAIAGALSVGGDTGLVGSLTVGGTLGVTGATTLGDTLDVTSAATLHDVLTVAGLVTVEDGLVQTSGDTILTGGALTLSYSGAAQLSAASTVVQAASFQVLGSGGTPQALYVNAALAKTLLGNGMFLTAPAPLNDTLTVLGRAYLAALSEDVSLALRYQPGTGDVFLGATNSPTPDLVVKGAAGTEVLRIAGSAATADPPATDTTASAATQAKGWACVSYSGGTPSLAASYNVDRVVDSATGVLSVVWDRPFASDAYEVSAAIKAPAGTPLIWQLVDQSTAHVQLRVQTPAGVATDPDRVYVGARGTLS